MNQQQVVKFMSDCGKIVMHCDTDTALGVLHDFLMKMKGCMIERMINAHKSEEEQSEEMKVREVENPCCNEKDE